MFQIYKCLRLSRNFPRRGNSRNICVDNYECKSPPPAPSDSLDEYLKEWAEHRKPAILKVSTCNADKKVKFWKVFFFLVCVPGLVCGFLNYYSSQETHRKRLKFVEFSYLRIRRKPFHFHKGHPDHTLFHNPRYNALPTGYEVEVPEEEEIDPFDLWRY